MTAREIAERIEAAYKEGWEAGLYSTYLDEEAMEKDWRESSACYHTLELLGQLDAFKGAE